MKDFGTNSSFWQTRKRRQVLKRTLGFYVATVILVLLFSIFGVRILTSFAFFLERISPKDITRQEKVIPPLPPRLEPTFEATNSASISIKGASEDTTTVELFVNGESFGTRLVGKDGLFTFENVSLKEGTNRIFGKATNAADVTSASSLEINVVFDKNPPKLDVLTPTDGQAVTGPDGRVTVSGKTQNIDTLTVNDRLVIISPDGNFSFVLTLSEGENNVKIVGKSKSGNNVTVEKKVTYQR
jgi:hypothetical protein